MATFSENIIEVVKKQYRTKVFGVLSVFFIGLLSIFQHFVCIKSILSHLPYRSFYTRSALVASIFHHIRQMSSPKDFIHPGRFLLSRHFMGMKLIFQVMWPSFFSVCIRADCHQNTTI